MPDTVEIDVRFIDSPRLLLTCNPSVARQMRYLALSACEFCLSSSVRASPQSGRRHIRRAKFKNGAQCEHFVILSTIAAICIRLNKVDSN